jgi:hypothetical protein
VVAWVNVSVTLNGFEKALTKTSFVMVVENVPLRSTVIVYSAILSSWSAGAVVCVSLYSPWGRPVNATLPSESLVEV